MITKRSGTLVFYLAQKRGNLERGEFELTSEYEKILVKTRAKGL